MAELTEEQKAALEAEKKKKEEEDPFAEIFGTTTTEDEETETDTETDDDEEKDKDKEKDKKKVKPPVDIQKQVDQRVTDAVAQIDRRASVNEFLTGDTGRMFGQYAEQIRKAAADPRFAAIPVRQLPQLILKPEAYVKVLDEAKKKADEEASDSVIGGSSAKNMTPEELRTIDPLSMSSEEFAKLKNRAKAGAFRIKK
jgi:hypothetical protein